MKRFYSYLLLLVFITFLVADSASYHSHHEIEDKGIVKHENFDDCDLCLFSSINSNSYSIYNEKPLSHFLGFKSLDIINESENYTKLFDDHIFQRGPPEPLS